MVNQVQKTNAPIIKNEQLQGRSSQNIAFKAYPISAPIPNDSYHPKNEPKGLTGLEKFLSATSAGLAITTAILLKKSSSLNGHLASYLEKLGTEVPKSLIGKVSKLFDFASKDGMTGLFNKKSLESSIVKYYQKAMEKETNLAVAFMDMDNFKGINEVFDHDRGDYVLKQIAKNVKEVAEKHNLKSFRYGGEEFVITAPNCDAKQLHEIIVEASNKIKNDTAIQGLVDEFTKKAKSDIQFLTNTRTKLNEIFSGLRKGSKNDLSSLQLKDDITKVVQSYIDKYKLHKNKPLKAVIDKLNSTPEKELKSFLNINTQIDEKLKLTLGNELNKIFTNCGDTQNDLQKWINHLEYHKLFTVSGGVADLKSHPLAKNGEELIKLADGALKTAKENGKATIEIAHS